LLEHGTGEHEERVMLNRFAAAVAIALPFTLGVPLAHAQLSKAPGKPDFTAELIVGGID
jgi:hypothetical protein